LEQKKEEGRSKKRFGSWLIVGQFWVVVVVCLVGLRGAPSVASSRLW
jgi:hypothetical protein